MAVRFVLDDELVTIDAPDPTATLLDVLRGPLRRTGTKEGCAEGDCGACTVLVGEADGANGNRVAWRAVNSCIQFLPMVDGKAVLTVESLGSESPSRGGALNSLQAIMAENGASQCGFCTPGFVMALYGRAVGASGAGLPVADVIAGNLCRCTGYGPILAAGEAVSHLARDDGALAARLAALTRAKSDVVGTGGDCRWRAPQTVESLCNVLVDHPYAQIVAGATDVALWVTKGLRTLPMVVFIGDIAELRGIAETANGVTIGAAVRHAEAHDVLARLHPDLGELMRRFAGLQVRNAGTVGGNIANGSPIGDLPPALIALGAHITLRSVEGVRTMPLEDFFIDYGKQDRRIGDFVESIFIPRPAPDDVILIAKLSRRFDSDISAVCGAFRLRMADGVVADARIAFGGMAVIPRRAPACEAALIGAQLNEATITRAAAALRADFAPLTDVRGSAAYRLDAAASLLHRLWHRQAGTAVSVLDIEACDG